MPQSEFLKYSKNDFLFESCAHAVQQSLYTMRKYNENIRNTDGMEKKNKKIREKASVIPRPGYTVISNVNLSHQYRNEYVPESIPSKRAAEEIPILNKIMYGTVRYSTVL